MILAHFSAAPKDAQKNKDPGHSVSLLHRRTAPSARPTTLSLKGPPGSSADQMCRRKGLLRFLEPGVGEVAAEKSSLTHTWELHSVKQTAYSRPSPHGPPEPPEES